MSQPVDGSLGWMEALGLGALQGMAEFLPISSSGHLALAQCGLGLGKVPLFFDVMLHVGTLAAVVFYYRQLILAPFSGATLSPTDGGMPQPATRAQTWLLVWWLALATIPAVAAKLAFPETNPNATPTWRTRVGDLREQSSARPGVVLVFLACTSVVLVVAAQARSGTVDIERMNWRYALAMGVAQALSALCPGLSRSGMTISTALLLGLRADWAVHFSLLMSIPVIAAAAVWQGRHLDPAWLPLYWQPTLLGTLVSAVVGWISIGLLARSVARGRWMWFAVYLWVLIALVGGGMWSSGRLRF